MLKVITDPSSGFKTLTATCDISSGTVMKKITGKEILPEPTMYTIHTGKNEHTVIPPDVLAYTNHCCRTPNARFDFTTQPWSFVSTKDINEGEWVTYDYVTTEFTSGAPFDCNCGSEECRGEMKGFFYLSAKEKEEMIKAKKVSPIMEWLHEQNPGE